MESSIDGVSRREGCRKWKRAEQAQKTDPNKQERCNKDDKKG